MTVPPSPDTNQFDWGVACSSLIRLLQSRRIVTKVLISVIPLVVLIAGVGLVGYHTANILNGHMTVTRATIENISDFENLQAAFAGVHHVAVR